MTLFVPDWSNNNWNNTAQAIAACDSVIHREGYSGIIHKVSEGNSYADPYWPAVRDWCAQNNVPHIGYHYVRTGDPAGQAAKWNANGGGPFAMLDFEDGSGDISNFWAVVNAFNAAGVQVALSYIPRWYWINIGRPDLSKVPGLIASNYVSGNGYASTLYPGDNYAWYDASSDGAGGWEGYGGVDGDHIALWQFSDKASMAGIMADVNAFRGTLDQLRALFDGTSVTPPPVQPPTPPAQPPSNTGAITNMDANGITGLIGGTNTDGTPLIGPDGADYRRVDLLAQYVGPGIYGTNGATPEGPNTTRSILDEDTTLSRIFTRRYLNKHGQELDAFDLLVALYRAAGEPQV